jgi:hypothetical protein
MWKQSLLFGRPLLYYFSTFSMAAKIHTKKNAVEFCHRKQTFKVTASKFSHLCEQASGGFVVLIAVSMKVVVF